MHRIHFVNSFSCKAAFAIQILIRIRNGASVNIKTSFTCVDGSQSRACRTLHADSHSRLKNAISGNYDIFLRINHRLIQRMGHGPNHSLRGIARKFGVRVQGNYIANAGENRKVADFYWKTIKLPAQQFIEIEQLAALAFPSHPQFLPWIVDTVPMKQEKRT